VRTWRIIVFFKILVRKHEGKEALRLWRILQNAVQTEGTEICTLIYRLQSFLLTFTAPCIGNAFSSITNKMQRYIIRLFLQDPLHVSDGNSANFTSSEIAHTASGICQAVTATFHCRSRAETAGSNGLTNTRCCMYSF
jgi:hypothetical protein